MSTRSLRRRMGFGTVLLVILLALSTTPVYATLPGSIDNGDGTATLVYRPTGGANDGTDEGGPNGGKDSYVLTYASRTVNFGTAPLLQHYHSTCNDFQASSYYQFDLTDLPGAAEVTKVSLVLYHNIFRYYGWQYQISPTTMQVQAVTGPWNEKSITYNTQPPVSPVLTSVNIPTTSSGYTGFVPIDMTSLYKDWKNGSRPNYGIRYSRLQPFCENGNLSYTASSDNPSESLRPRLEITYRHSTPPPVVDTTPPQISFTAGPANAAGWYNGDVTISFTCTDGLSGVASCTDPITLSGDGAGQSAAGTAVDRAGNSAGITVSDINIDKTEPVVTYTGNAGSYTVDQMISIACTSSDSLSGVADDTCAGIAGPAWSFATGLNSYSATATDKADNVGQGSTSFTVAATPDGLCALGAHFATSAGVAQGLCSKLEAARAAAAKGNANAKAGQIGAFINLVQAQTGKALTAEQAAILTRLVKLL